jgi:preprotein translocase subunit SecE
VARDRKRAKQRQQRRPQRTPAPASSEIHRADLPGALEHASSDVDEFDAALVRGAGGVPAPLEDAPLAADTDAADANGADELELASAGAGAGGGNRDGRGNGVALEASGDAEAALPSDRPATRERRQSLPRRAVGFLRASWAELQRVQWPNRTQVTQATAVVLGFVAVAGAYLGAADWLAQKIVNLIL